MAAGAPTDETLERTRRCPVCSGPITQPVQGRRRRYCTDVCRKTADRRRRDGAKRRGLVTLRGGDARTFLASLPAESIDLVVTDPPYEFAGGRHRKHWFADLPDDAWADVLRELYRVLRRDRHAYVFCDRRTHRVFEKAARKAGFRVHEPLIWDKDWIGTGGGCWRSQYELILFLEKGRRAGNRRDRANVLRVRRPHRGYPTEKPVALLKMLIDQSSASGELVLDPFCGSGNVGVAARELGRRALLCDIAPVFATRRLRLAAIPVQSAAARRNE